ncbi:MAG: hydrogenase [Clostridium sp.]|jgi:nitrogenase molybdenum-iron protein beta chain|uniref:nitrogenase component 1 n=1 Tax=Clostridium sp. TaxID=1506 RepID=UPI0025C5E182|nr:nitrogenase component 1 [Clostridium sp.]MCH3963716.1 hydrogenase [Clostridium sp.]MCI1714857.1 hydrogenase [Clostridium sp.]MCI1798954.1 hydrogenase [Clostridium sp.]MCI1813040.1 hydrogenase [Clostridium sp.]MCI1869930.1 hydrogenase [Clostridium sp.]
MLGKLNSNNQTNSIVHPRYGCAIGAAYTVSAIPRGIPLVHCGPGCVDKQYFMLSYNNGYQGGGYSGGSVIPSVNAGESEVIFGGAKKLDDLIRSSFKIMDGDLFVVLSGCIGELVGDDVGSVVKKYQKKGYPIVFAETGGFKGNNLIGHEIVIQSIIDQFVGEYDGEKENGLINVWTEVPYFNTYWRGDFIEIKRILEGCGFKVNMLFGSESKGITEWKTIPKAQFNLVISPWVGVKTAEYLKNKYNQPYLHIPIIPIGAEETTKFLRKVVEFSGINKDISEKFISEEENRYYYFLDHFSDFFSEFWFGLPSKYAVIGDSAYNIAINKFLVNQIGLIPVKQIITDNPPDKYRNSIQNEYGQLASDVSTNVEFIEDGYIIEKELRESEFGSSRPIIFASAWEKDIVEELKGIIIETSCPSASEVVINRTYVGYTGGLTLLEKIYTTSIDNAI